MKMSQGIEWSIHCCALLGTLPEGHSLRLEKIAEFYDLPVPYLRKHFQALSRAGIVKTVTGPKGGYRLARSADMVNLLDIYQAIEGDEYSFRCAEIRKQGPTACAQKNYPAACNIATSMWRAEAAWRNELASVTIAQVLEDAAKQIEEPRKVLSKQWLEKALSE
jgi:Rrf2 family protein